MKASKKRQAPVATPQPLEEDFPRGGGDLTPLERRQLHAQALAEVEAGDVDETQRPPSKKQRKQVQRLMGLTADAATSTTQGGKEADTSLKVIASQKAKSFVELIKFKVHSELARMNCCSPTSHTTGPGRRLQGAWRRGPSACQRRSHQPAPWPARSCHRSTRLRAHAATPQHTPAPSDPTPLRRPARSVRQQHTPSMLYTSIPAGPRCCRPTPRKVPASVLTCPCMSDPSTVA